MFERLGRAIARWAQKYLKLEPEPVAPVDVMAAPVLLPGTPLSEVIARAADVAGRHELAKANRALKRLKEAQDSLAAPAKPRRKPASVAAKAAAKPLRKRKPAPKR